MGYLHLDNLYKNQQILAFKRVYALEKIHGTSASVSWDGKDTLTFFSGGASHALFVGLFNEADLLARFKTKFGEYGEAVTIHGEAYGGKLQGMSATYGKWIKFVAFDVKIGDNWLSVPQAHDVVTAAGLEFVDYEEIEATLPEIDRVRDLRSTQAVRNGILEERIREGVVLRPPFEVTGNNGSRIIAKHKRDEFRESATPRSVDPAKAVLLTRAGDIATEWVTPMRLEHVIDRLVRERDEKTASMGDIPAVITLMQEDVEREAVGVDEWTKDIRKSIGNATVKLFKQRLDAEMRAANE